MITGGNSGIGLAAVKGFVQEGAYIFITGRTQSKLFVDGVSPKSNRVRPENTFGRTKNLSSPQSPILTSGPVYWGGGGVLGGALGAAAGALTTGWSAFI